MPACGRSSLHCPRYFVQPAAYDISDFHGRVHKPLAKQLVKLLEPHRPLFVEEPLLPGHPNEMKDLYNKTSIPIAVSVDRGQPGLTR